MPRKRSALGQGSIYQRNGWWWCDFSMDGVRRREACNTKDRDEALAYLHRRRGKLASGELLAPDRIRIRDLFRLLLNDYDVRQVAQTYIAGLKVKSILIPKLGNIKAAKLSTAQVQQYVRDRAKHVKASTVNRELGLLRRAFQLGYQHDPPLVARVPHFPKFPEGEPRKGFLRPEMYQNLLLEPPEHLRLLFVIAYHVGLRRGALLRIKWSQVDREQSCIWMEGKKRTGNPSPSPSRYTAISRSSWMCSRGKANTSLREVQFRSKTSGRVGIRLATEREFPTCSSMIFAGQPFAICGGRVSPKV
jgi:integrase